MAELLAQKEPYREIRRTVLNGDQEITTFDTSFWRRGAGFNIPLTSNLAVLANSNLVMDYSSHNVSCGENGNFYGRDDTGGCTIQLYGEDEFWRWWGAPLANKGVPPVWTQFMTYNALTGLLTPTNLGGTVAAGNAPAGAVGEFLTVGTTAPNTTALTTTVAANATSGSVTAGDWDVWGSVNFTPAVATSITVLAGGVNTVTATLPAQDLYFEDSFAANVPGTTVIITKPVPLGRVNVSVTTTVYLPTRATFTLGALGVGGTLWARRRR